MKKNYLTGILLIISLIAGFFVGKCTRQTKEVVRYVKGETITDTIVIPKPTFVEIPSKPKYIYKYDTIVVDNIQYISEKVDTSAIIQDYIVTRTYEFNVFNSDTLGKFDVKQKIGYNKLQSTPNTERLYLTLKSRSISWLIKNEYLLKFASMFLNIVTSTPLFKFFVYLTYKSIPY